MIYPFQHFHSIFGRIWTVILTVFSTSAHAQTDTSHYSTVFGGTKPYRIYLPASYHAQPNKKFPVIYYFHGNKGDHQLPFGGVPALVNDASVILVAWNGRSVPQDDRPYNIGYHSNINYQVQFKDYFLELVHHIDSSYRTLTDRANRGLIGHSMGGFMSFFLAGKYPQLVSISVNSKGSPEFFAGSPSRHTLYQQRYMFKNFKGVKQEPKLDFSYEAYEGPHQLNFEQFRDAFRFVAGSIGTTAPPPQRWHHADLYSEFDVWDYAVKSNLTTPGYIELNGVTQGGFTAQTRAWQPDGPSIPGTDLQISTAPVYRPNATYSILQYDKNKDSLSNRTITADATGRIQINTGGTPVIFGIRTKNSAPEIVLADFNAGRKDHFLPHKTPASIRLRLLNRGGSTSGKLTATLSTTTPSVSISQPSIQLPAITSGQLAWTDASFNVTANQEPPADGSSPFVKFQLTIKDEKGHSWEEEFDALPFFAVNTFNEIGIDDGDSEIYGSGNGNNIAEPGEKIMIYQFSHRTKLYFEDPYIVSETLHDDLQPDKWGDGYALSSLIRIAKNCPPGHVIRFLACYEVKEWKTIKRNVTWGTFSITVGQ
ncbi:alpha/beta fold hydrolase [uncultured Chitinophaga sp.]|uniref:alpha/beta fold hydrolase n=1 Tax=uncultured Chitinophaga sp. TaxID=339340 RepID=UPI0026234AC8|nr:alpha/beta fold hydrolase [uncultured Chitinophaga sp.]